MCYDAVPFWRITEHIRNHFFHSVSITTTSSATSEQGTVPEKPSRNEEPTKRKEEQTRKTASFRQISVSNGAQQADMYFWLSTRLNMK